MATETRLGHQGWFEEPHDDRDKMYQDHAPKDLTIAPRVNLWTLYPQSQIPVYDQGQTLTCVANATAAALWYQLKVTQQTAMQNDGPSRLFIYWNARISELAASAETVPPNNGCYCRRALRSLEKKGGCSEKLWEFSARRVQLEPNSNAYSTAEECKIDTYWRLDPSRPVDDLTHTQMVEDGQETLLSARQCLSEGFPIVFGYKNFSSTPLWKKGDDGIWVLGDLWKDGIIKPHQKPGDFGGHAVLMIGYDDDKGMVICQNSWGKDSSRPGAPIFYMPYNWILDYEATSDFWTLRKNVRSKS